MTLRTGDRSYLTFFSYQMYFVSLSSWDFKYTNGVAKQFLVSLTLKNNQNVLLPYLGRQGKLGAYPKEGTRGVATSLYSSVVCWSSELEETVCLNL